MLKKLPPSFTLVPALRWVVLVSVPSLIITAICRTLFLFYSVCRTLTVMFIEHLLCAGPVLGTLHTLFH